MLVNFERKRVVQTTRSFELFGKKNKQTKHDVFLKPFLQRDGAILADVFVAKIIV